MIGCNERSVSNKTIIDGKSPAINPAKQDLPIGPAPLRLCKNLEAPCGRGGATVFSSSGGLVHHVSQNWLRYIALTWDQQHVTMLLHGVAMD